MDKMGVLETLTTALICVAAGNTESEEKSLKEGFVVLQRRWWSLCARLLEVEEKQEQEESFRYAGGARRLPRE